MQTLRAFLLIRQARGEWTASVHRDLESLIDAWKPFEDQEITTGIIHVGFGRPNTEAFEETAERYPGKMLLSASARYALGLLGDCASQAVGEADHIPIYVALSGWGYTTKAGEIGLVQAHDVTFLSSPAICAGKGDPQNEGLVNGHEDEQINWHIQTDWIQGLSSIDPELLEAAKNVGIAGEKSYFEREKLLDAAHRARLGYCRLRILLDEKDYQNPIEIARCAPPWLLARPILSLGLSVRAENCLGAAHIHTVFDLARFSHGKGLLGLSNFGLKTNREVATALMAGLHGGPFGLMTEAAAPPAKESETAGLSSGDIVDRDPAQAAENNTVPSSALGSTFVESLEAAIKSLPKGRDVIVKNRMGFAGKRSTLQEIADVVGVTRERIRQIETYAVRMLSTRFQPLWSEIVIPKIEAILAGRTDPLPLLGLDIFDPWFRDVEDIPEPFGYCLEHLCGGRFSLIRVNNQLYISHLTPAEWGEAIDHGEKTLEAAVGQSWRLSHARSMIDGLLSGKGEELRPMLWETVTSHARFSNVDDGEPVLVAYGRGVEKIIEAILTDSDRSLHYTEIARKITEQFGRPVEARYVHAATGRVGLLYGLGTYGLMKHFPLSNDEVDIVIAETEDLIESGKAERQWHCSEICEGLAEHGIDFEGRLNPYVLNIALRRSKVLAYLGRLVWTAAAGRKLTSAHRIGVPQAIASLLRDEGRPMSYQEIRERLTKERGLSDYFQIFSRGPLIHLGQGLWGLLDRDLPITETEQEIVFDEIEKVLHQRQSGLHVTEIVGALNKTRDIAERIDGTTLMTLAQRDGRMRVGYGQYLYLTEWGESRRMQLAEAFKTALEQSSNGLRAQEIVDAVSALLGRPINPQNIYGPLSAIGAEWSEKTGRWVLVDATEENGSEDV